MSMIYYKPTKFKPYELVPKSVYDKKGANSLIVMDARILYTLDNVRNYFEKPVYVNNWDSGGTLDQRGFREDASTGVLFSQHRYGRAIDFDVKGMMAEEVRQAIIASAHMDIFRFITAMETGITWVHIDCRNMDRKNGKINLFTP